MWQMKVVLIPLPPSLSPIFSYLSCLLKSPLMIIMCPAWYRMYLFQLLDAISLSGPKSKALTIDGDSELAKPNPNSVQLELSISLCLVFLMHHTQSLTLFILQPVSFFLRLFSSDGCHYTRYAPLELLTQRSLLCLTLTERLRPLPWLISPCRLCLHWLISSLFPSLFRLLFTRTALNRLRLASSKDYRNHHLSLPVLELIGLTALLWREGCDCGPNTRLSWTHCFLFSTVKALLGNRGCYTSLQAGWSVVRWREWEKVLAWMLSTSWAPCREDYCESFWFLFMYSEKSL